MVYDSKMLVKPIVMVVPKIRTHDIRGVHNGDLWALLNKKTAPKELAEAWPQQIYITTVLGKMSKGPHVHRKRSGAFVCVVGRVRILIQYDGNILSTYLAAQEDYQKVVFVPRNVPVKMANPHNENATVLNMPGYDSWSPEDTDDENGTFDLSFPIKEV